MTMLFDPDVGASPPTIDGLLPLLEFLVVSPRSFHPGGVTVSAIFPPPPGAWSTFEPRFEVRLRAPVHAVFAVVLSVFLVTVLVVFYVNSLVHVHTTILPPLVAVVRPRIFSPVGGA